MPGQSVKDAGWGNPAVNMAVDCAADQMSSACRIQREAYMEVRGHTEQYLLDVISAHARQRHCACGRLKLRKSSCAMRNLRGHLDCYSGCLPEWGGLSWDCEVRMLWWTWPLFVHLSATGLHEHTQNTGSQAYGATGQRMVTAMRELASCSSLDCEVREGKGDSG